MFHVKHRTSGCRRIRWRYRAMNDGPAAALLREWPGLWSGSAGRIRMRRQAIPHSKGRYEALLSTPVRNTPAGKALLNAANVQMFHVKQCANICTVFRKTL